MINERDCIRYSIHLPEIISKTDSIKRDELKKLILDVSPFTVIRETDLTCMIKEGEVSFVKWTVSVSLSDAEKLFNLMTWWADEYTTDRLNTEGKMMNDIMIEKEFIRRIYMG
tara:strand:+ start:2156 stop:2494 length:339 start_codon:yes stop_codon:yes gene_type:complete